VNRLLVKRMTFSQAYIDITFATVPKSFLASFPTNVLKFPAFKFINNHNKALSFTALVALRVRAALARQRSAEELVLLRPSPASGSGRAGPHWLQRKKVSWIPRRRSRR